MSIYPFKTSLWLEENKETLKSFGFDVEKAIRNVNLWNEYVNRYNKCYPINYADLSVIFNISEGQAKRIIYKFKKECQFENVNSTK